MIHFIMAFKFNSLEMYPVVIEEFRYLADLGLILRSAIYTNL